MGRRVTSLVSASGDIGIVAGLDAPDSSDLGRDLGEISFVGPTGARIWPAPEIEEVVARTRPQILVDFSNADASTSNVVKAAGLGLGVVMGTTGHTPDQLGRITSSIRSNKVAAVISPNMSVGVNVLLEACDIVARMVPDYDVEVFEIHHNQKIDSPSGTALKLAQRVAESLDKDSAQVIISGRTGKGKRREAEIGIASLRAGDIVGDHTVIFAGLGERIELTHRAQSRDAFASGVLASVRFVSKAPPGIYSMKDVLKATPSG